MKRIPCFLLLVSLLVSLIIPYNSFGQNIYNKQDLEGSWMGSLNVGAMSLRIVFNLKITDVDSLIATMDSPDQGAKDIPLGRVSLKMDSLIIEAPMLLGKYSGHLETDTTIDGIWTQRGRNLSLNLLKLADKFTLNRPQEPKEPVPYISEEVNFPNDKFNISLSGTLTIPEGEGPFPAVVMITGSGAQNRDEALMGHKPFLVIADWLTRKGIAVLRYDDRGVGKSQGNYANATSADLATDAEAAVTFLRSQSKINKKAIGLIGHSEGGLIAPIAAATDPTIAFIVSLAGPGVKGEKLLYRQVNDISRISGTDEESIKEATSTNRKLYRIVKKEKDNNKAEAKVLEAYSKILSARNLSDEEMKRNIDQLKLTFGATSYTWYRYFLITDPAKFWKKVKCPVLALNGQKDLQVAADLNLTAIEKAVKSGGNKNIKTISFPDLNHLFQHCTTGLPSEYGAIEETFSPEVLKIISDWINDLEVSR
jgi:alpha-beta hydrolase superfamily lysophospholipase